MKNFNVPFNRPFISGKELFYIADSVMKGHISGNGYYTKKCESFLQEFTHCRKVLMTNSCTAALEMACILIDLKPGDEVIMPSFTFVSTANAVVLRGATPVFCDINPQTFNLDETQLKSCLSEKTKAIIPVHYAGQSCEMKAINDFAKNNNLYVIEDAAQSVGAYHHGQHSGTIGDMGCFSFHETKNIMCGEGGALLINNPKFIDQAEIIREKGTNREAFFRNETEQYTWVDQGSSYLPSELQMAFLYAQLENIEQVIKRRRKAVEYYDIHLKPLEGRGLLSLPNFFQHNKVNYHLYAILCRDEQERSKLIEYLKDRGIGAVFHYIPLHSSPAGRKLSRTAGDNLPVTDLISSQLLRLPVYYDITIEEQNYVVNALNDFYQNR
ncbi:MAG: dTDP-4-amino-4,6-dideoxygalactose transaminase [Anaerolineae bacterium]|nr:dTDP-4-amino-4,6-dideoxygalactose transaminase [Anaerolineae bacterium]